MAHLKKDLKIISNFDLISLQVCPGYLATVAASFQATPGR